MRAKTPHSSIKRKKATKLPRDNDYPKSLWFQSYRDSSTFKLQPVPESIIERIVEDLNIWAQKPDSLRLQDFYWEKDICDDTYYEWVKKYPLLNFYHRKAKNTLASRREKGMLSKEMPESGVLKSLYKYDPLYAEIRAEDKQDKIDISLAIKAAEEQSGPRIVVLESFNKLKEGGGNGSE